MMTISGYKIQDAAKIHFQSSTVSRQPSEKGFTLIEILVAIALLGIAITIVIQLFSANLRAISASEDYVAATIKAEIKMREILDDDNLTENNSVETTDDGYSFDIAVYDSLKDRTEILQVRLFQIDLTIHWTKGKKNKVLTLHSLKMIKKQI